MNKPPPLQALARNFLILLILLMLILTPRPATGYLDLRRARRSVATEDYAGAAPVFASAASRIPWRSDLWALAGQSAFTAGEPGQAVQWFAQAEKHQALSLSDWIAYGDSFQRLGDMQSAVWAWEQSIDRHEPSAGAYWRLAKAHRLAGEYEQAVACLQKALDLAPEDADVHYELGLLFAATAPEKALPELIQAAQLDPSLDASVQSLRTALNTAFNSDDPAYRFLFIGRALGALGDWDLAAEAFRNAISVRADYAEAWAWLGEAKQQQGQDGKIEIERALAFNPDSAMLQSLYGLYLQRQKQPVKALAAFQKAAALEPEDPGWQMALGRAYEQTDDLVAALEHYQRAVELAPEDASVWRALAEFSLRDGVDLTGIGLPAARRLVELARDDWQSLDIAGQIIFETGDPVGAEVLLKKALELGPTQAAPALHLGLLYLQTGDRPAAYSHLNQAKVFDPDGPYGWQAKRLLEQYFP